MGHARSAWQPRCSRHGDVLETEEDMILADREQNPVWWDAVQEHLRKNGPAFLLGKAFSMVDHQTHVQSYDVMPIAYSVWDELTVRFYEFPITVTGILTPIRTELPVKKPTT